MSDPERKKERRVRTLFSYLDFPFASKNSTKRGTNNVCTKPLSTKEPR